MLRIEQISSNESELAAKYTVEATHKPKASMLYNVLPAMVRSRMPSLPSIRHSISDFRTRTSHGKKDSVSELSLPVTPPPGYRSRPGSGSTTPCRPSSSASTSVLDFDDDVFANRSTSSIPPLQTIAYETSTGINWQHARYGMKVLNQAHQQSSASPIEIDEVMADIIRTQYLQSITLLLRSLPPTLTPTEQLNLVTALPRNVLGTHDSLHTRALIRTRQVEFPVTPPTALQRAMAWLVFRLFILIQILLPYIRKFLRDAAQFEEEHQITRRMFNTSVTLGSGISRECWKATQAVCRMNDGAVGEALFSATLYCTEGVTGGIQQGIAEALRSQQMKGQKAKDQLAIRELAHS